MRTKIRHQNCQLIFCLTTVLMLFIGTTMIFGQSVEVKWNEVHQTITGFGASGGNSSAQNFLKLSESDRKALCDLFFSADKGIGLTMVRNELYWHIEPSPGVWDWKKDSAQVWLMNEAQKRGVNYFWSAAWSMPVWMKDNQDIKHGGHLLPAHYQDYADYLSKYVREYKSRFNLEIRAVSIQNEPDQSTNYQSCLWNGSQFLNFVKNNLGPTFRKDRIKAKIVFPEPSDFRKITQFADSTMNDPDARKYVSIIAAHQYDQSFLTKPDTIFPKDSLEGAYGLGKKYGKELWQSENSFIGGKPEYGIIKGIGAALMIYNTMVKSEVNAYVWWAFLNSWGDNEGLVDLTGNTYKISKRLYAFGNFSRFVRPGYVMIGITNTPKSGVYCLAFKNPKTKKFAIIMINKNAEQSGVDAIFSGFKAGSVTPWVTSELYDLEKQSDVKVNDSKNGFTANLPGLSITTFIGKEN